MNKFPFPISQTSNGLFAVLIKFIKYNKYCVDHCGFFVNLSDAEIAMTRHMRAHKLSLTNYEPQPDFKIEE